jgi:branched-chain amino acid transport system substrate-binding protein
MVFPHASFDVDSEAPDVRAFVQAYQDTYGATPDTYAAHGYDALKILALAVQDAGTSSEDIRFYLNSMNPYEGVTGATAFTDTGDVRKFHTMLTVVGAGVYHVDALPRGSAGGAGHD